jgi:hypothetical protein
MYVGRLRSLLHRHLYPRGGVWAVLVCVCVRLCVWGGGGEGGGNKVRVVAPD